MKKFVIERNFPGAANLSAAELQLIAQTSCEGVSKLGKPYTWVESFITGDKIYCIHIAESDEVIREHSRISKFPLILFQKLKRPLTQLPAIHPLSRKSSVTCVTLQRRIFCI